jgi:SAM-dependent methyltransferase
VWVVADRGSVFNEVAREYDRHRPTYPQALIDRACERLSPGDEVLEVGCGTGQLTRGLLARGLRVTAIEPGARLAALARERLQGELDLVEARLEDAHLPRAGFRAVFSASAIHWVDPDVGWRIAAEALAPGGTLALIQYFGLRDPADDQDELLGTMRAVAPQATAHWPRYRDLESTLAGARERRGNISEAWAWLGGYDIAREHAADLFGDAEIAVEPVLMEQTADELNAVIGTMSFWARASPQQREALQRANRDLCERLGRPIRSSTVACLVAARRRGELRRASIAA